MERQIILWSLYYQVAIAVVGVIVGAVLLMVYLRRRRASTGDAMPAWIFWSGLSGTTGVGFLALWFYFRVAFEQTLEALQP